MVGFVAVCLCYLGGVRRAGPEVLRRFLVLEWGYVWQLLAARTVHYGVARHRSESWAPCAVWGVMK